MMPGHSWCLLILNRSVCCPWLFTKHEVIITDLIRVKPISNLVNTGFIILQKTIPNENFSCEIVGLTE